jgi:ribonuclease HI
MKLIIYTDGASRGNPGLASYGFTISNEDGGLVYEEGKYIGVTTNNVAEYQAVLSALEYVKESVPRVSEIAFFADSRLVVEQLSGRFKIKSLHLLELIKQIRRLQETFPKVTYTHVFREKNTAADALANKALDQRIPSD